MRNRLYALRVLFLPLLLCFLLAACGSTGGSSTSGGGTTATATATATTSPKAVTLNVFAAASLTESFTEIGKNFQTAHSNVTIKFNFAGSQTLVQQLTNGAPADVFASADTANMTKATNANLVDSPQTFARNELVVLIPASNPGKIMSLKDLANKGIKIDVGSSAVPVGKYTLQALDKLGASADYGKSYESAVKANIVSQEDNDKAIVTKVQLGEVDAGFVYFTDVTAKIASKVNEVTIPNNFNVVAVYPIAVTKNSADPSDAQAFVQYVLSSDGQAVLQKYKFLSPSA